MNISYVVVMLMFIIVTQIPCFLALMIFYPFYKIFKHNVFLSIPYYLCKKAFTWTNNLFFDVQHIKTVDFDTTKRYVYLPNHQSYADPVIGSNLNPFFVITIANGYVKYVPIFGQNAYLLDVPFVGKDKGITQFYTSYLIKHPERVLALFPEGHRNFAHDFKYEDIKTGGFVIAKNTGQQIVPMYHNMMDRMDDVKKEYHGTAQIYCLYGKPIDVEGKEIDVIKKEYYDAMTVLKNKVNEMRKLKI